MKHLGAHYPKSPSKTFSGLFRSTADTIIVKPNLEHGDTKAFHVRCSNLLIKEDQSPTLLIPPANAMHLNISSVSIVADAVCRMPLKG